jgi:uncharacterized membrane protein YagU involved in acid resistance
LDRFCRGFFSGVIGGIFMDGWDLFSYHLLSLTNRRYLDWVSVILQQRLPENTFQAVYFLVFHLLWVGALGVVFAYLVPGIKDHGYIFKGILYSLVIGFFIYACAPTFFRVPYFIGLPFTSVVSNHIGGLIWGTVLAVSLRYFDQKTTR